jgi:hypothetical protein
LQVCHFPNFWDFFPHIPGTFMWVSHFFRFLVLLPYSRSYSVHFSFSTFSRVSRNIPGLTVYIGHFPTFSVFLATFQVLSFEFLIFFFVF